MLTREITSRIRKIFKHLFQELKHWHNTYLLVDFLTKKKCWITNISMFCTFSFSLGGIFGVLDDDAFLSQRSENTLSCKDSKKVRVS